MGASESQPENEEDSRAEHSATSMSAESIQPKKLRNARVTILDEILKEKAKLNEQLKKENVAILKAFLESFVEEMKKHDATFAKLFQRICYTGSFFCDLRVSIPDEFDLNLVLKMPKAQDVSYNPQVPSYMKFRITDGKLIETEKGFSKLFKDDYLMPNNVRIWIQGVVDKARLAYRLPSGILKIDSSASGPARTLKLIKRNGDVIDIDLVPAVQCSLGLKPPGIHGPVYEKVKDELQCFLIPKPYQPSRQAPVNDAERSRLWRAHYPDAEKTIIHDRGCVKNVIKLLKLLRDKENWVIVASYYLKTIVMWMIIENPSQEYWRMDKMGERFLDALNELAKCIKERRIRYFFSSKYNLLEKLTEAQASNIHYRLLSIIKSIERDDNKLWEIFGCRPTFVM